MTADTEPLFVYATAYDDKYAVCPMCGRKVGRRELTTRYPVDVCGTVKVVVSHYRCPDCEFGFENPRADALVSCHSRYTKRLIEKVRKLNKILGIEQRRLQEAIECFLGLKIPRTTIQMWIADEYKREVTEDSDMASFRDWANNFYASKVPPEIPAQNKLRELCQLRHPTPQKQCNDCVVASCATALGIEYNQAWELLLPDGVLPLTGIKNRVLLDALRRVGCEVRLTAWQGCVPAPNKVNLVSIVRYTANGIDEEHCISIDPNGILYDPEDGGHFDFWHNQYYIAGVMTINYLPSVENIVQFCQ